MKKGLVILRGTTRDRCVQTKANVLPIENSERGRDKIDINLILAEKYKPQLGINIRKSHFKM
jgi:hypothetical protein